MHLICSCTGISAAMFMEKEDIPAMSVAAVEKKYHCVIEVDAKTLGSVANPRRRRQALLFNLFLPCMC